MHLSQVGRRDQSQRCKVCGRRDKFNFHVSDAIWEAIVPASYVNRVVCLACFDDFALQKGVNYAATLDSLYFAGDRAAFTFSIVSAANIEDPICSYCPSACPCTHRKAHRS